MIGYCSNNEDVAFGVMYFPERKKPCLVVKDKNVFTKVASFNNEESAIIFMNTVSKVFNIQEIGWNGDNIPLGLSLAYEDMFKYENEIL